MNWMILPIDQHTKKRESSGGILDELDDSLVDEHTKKKNPPEESLDNSFLGEIHPEESEPYWGVTQKSHSNSIHSYNSGRTRGLE